MLMKLFATLGLPLHQANTQHRALRGRSLAERIHVTLSYNESRLLRVRLPILISLLYGIDLALSRLVLFREDASAAPGQRSFMLVSLPFVTDPVKGFVRGLVCRATGLDSSCLLVTAVRRCLACRGNATRWQAGM